MMCLRKKKRFFPSDDKDSSFAKTPAAGWNKGACPLGGKAARKKREELSMKSTLNKGVYGLQS